MERTFRIIEVTKPNGQIYYEAQQRFWLFGTRWRNALQDGWGLVSCAHTFSTAKDGPQKRSRFT